MKNKRAIVLLLIPLIIAALVITIGLQKRSLTRVRMENSTLSQQAARVRDLEEENQALSKIKLKTNELDWLREQVQNLPRLRGKVAQLTRDLSEAKSRLENTNGEPKEVDVTPELKETTRKVMFGVTHIASDFAAENNKRFPTNVSELRSKLLSKLGPQGGQTVDELEERFEFVPHDNPLTWDDYGQLLLREKKPHRRSTDGKYVRQYIFVGNFASEAVSDQETFDDWERAAPVPKPQN